ncbi:hypothetical protein RJ640_000933 [Escallonia rubra]|uniref:Reverse transcriptase Ty1/copia-type domain-containing protein n=1 Tax=Escallonia rubra TaxID=112253 RepID=A0AA88R726_9ASTE|nr:hypothetical protein RJ640_000933 [Escallonia rubra]
MSYILVYVDDIIVTGNSSTQITSLINSLRFEFSLKDLSQFHYFLGIEVSYAQTDFFLSQRHYINDILSKTGGTREADRKLIQLKYSYGAGGDLGEAQRLRSKVVGWLWFGDDDVGMLVVLEKVTGN